MALGNPTQSWLSDESGYNRFLLDQNASTNIANPPNAAGFNLDTDAVIDWETPTLR